METPAPRYDRYPGIRSFSDNAAEQQLFFGRDREVRELLHQILSTQLLVVYGKSGRGKTSLLQAGIFPRLRQRDFLPLTIRLNDLEQPPPGFVFPRHCGPMPARRYRLHPREDLKSVGIF